MTSIRAVLFVLAQWLLHQCRHLDVLLTDARALNAPLTRKISKQLEPEHDMPSPPLAWLEAFAVTHPIRVRKACGQICRVITSQVHAASKRHELPPNCAVAPQ